MTNDSNKFTSVNVQTKIAIGALIIICIFLGFILLRGCSYSKSLNEEKDKLKAIADSIQKREIDANRIINAQLIRIDTIEVNKAKLQKESSLLQAKLDISENKASSLAKQVKLSKIAKDTPTFFIACDSLADVVDSVIALEQSDRTKINSILTLSNQKSLIQDSIIIQKNKLYSDLRNSWSSVLREYNNTLVDYNKLQKKYKRERTLTRIVAGVGIILAGVVIAK